MHSMVMHEGQLSVTAEMARNLVGGQFPEYASLPIEPVRSAGSVNAICRIGEPWGRLPIAMVYPDVGSRRDRHRSGYLDI